MRRRVHPVRSDIHLQDIITLYIIIIFRQCTDNRVSRQYDNTGMIGSDTDLILGANHAIRLNPADLRLLDRETLVAIIQFRPVNSDNHLLACRHVRSATNNLQWRLATHIHRRDMQMIGIRMVLTCQDLSNNQALKATLNRLDLFNPTSLQTDRGQGRSYFIRL